MSKALILLMAFVLAMGILAVPSDAEWFNGTHDNKALNTINTTGNANQTNIANATFLINGSQGIYSLAGTNSTPTPRHIWSVANTSSSNNTQYYLYYTSPTDFQVVNGTEAVAVPFELENGSVSFNPTAVWSPRNFSIVAHFGEGGGTTTEDSTSFGNDGSTVGSGITFNSTSSKFGNFITHNGGTNTYMSFGDTASIAKGNTITASMWFRAYKGGAYQALFNKGSNTGDDLFYVRMNPDNKLEFSIDGGVQVTSAAITFGVWNFVTFTYDGTSVRGWLNGRFVGSGTATLVQSTQVLSVCGDRSGSGQDTYLGDCDEFRLTNYNLTNDQIYQMYLEGGSGEISKLGVAELEPIPNVAPFFGSTANDTYQGPNIFTAISTGYNSNLNYSRNINITDSNGDSQIHTVIFQINGTNFSNRGPPVNPGTWHNLNLRIYNKSVGGQFYINFTPPLAGSYVGFAWVNDTSNNQNQSINFSGLRILSQVAPTPITMIPNDTVPINPTYNSTVGENCYSSSNDTSPTVNFYHQPSTVSNFLLVAPSLSFLYPGGSNQASCDIRPTQNYTETGDNSTFTVNNGTVNAIRKFLNGLPRNLSVSDLVNVTIVSNSTTSDLGLNFTLFVNGTYYYSNASNSSFNFIRWLTPGIHVISMFTNGSRNYSSLANESIYINVHAGLQDIRTTFNTPLFETNWTTFNFSAYINDSVNIINVTAHLRWNGTNESFDSVINRSNSMNFTNNFTIPLINLLNNTVYGHNWSYIIYYRNGSSLLSNTSNSTQSVMYAYNFTSLSSDKSVYSQVDVANISVSGVNKFFNPSVNHTIRISFNGTTFNNNSFSLNATWRSPDFDSNWTFYPIQMPLQTVNNTTLVVNASYTVQFQGINRTTFGLGTISIRILRSALGECAGNFATPVIGFFTYNESTRGNTTADVSRNAINNSIDATFTIYQVTNSSNFYTSSFALRNNTNYYICLDVNQSFTVDGDITYQPTSNHPPRNYFLSNATLTSSSVQEIKLFTLHNALSNRINFIVKDSAGTLLPEHIVKFLRYYLDVNLFETVTMLKSDSFGEGNTYLQLNDVFYKMIVEKAAVVRTEYRSQTFKCADTTDCSFTNIVPTVPSLELFEYQNKIGFNCQYTNSSLTLSCTASDPTGAARRYCLDIKETSFIRPNQTAYTCVSSSAAVLGYTFEAFNSSKTFSWKFIAELRENLVINSTILDSGTLSWGGRPIYGTQGLSVGLLVILAIAVVGMLISPVAGIVMTLFAMGIMQFIGVISFESDIVSSGFAGLVVVGLIIMWFIRRRD